MDDHGKGILGNPEVTGEEIRRAWEYAASKAMDEHRRTGVPVTTWDWENQRVLLIPADEIPQYDEQTFAEKSASEDSR
jgi:hypothetical protein